LLSIYAQGVKQLIIVKIVTAIMKIETAEINKHIFKILLSFRFFNSFSSESIILKHLSITYNLF